MHASRAFLPLGETASASATTDRLQVETQGGGLALCGRRVDIGGLVGGFAVAGRTWLKWAWETRFAASSLRFRDWAAWVEGSRPRFWGAWPRHDRRAHHGGDNVARDILCVESMSTTVWRLSSTDNIWIAVLGLRETWSSCVGLCAQPWMGVCNRRLGQDLPFSYLAARLERLALGACYGVRPSLAPSRVVAESPVWTCCARLRRASTCLCMCMCLAGERGAH
jgi:hypothetical protein